MTGNSFYPHTFEKAEQHLAGGKDGVTRPLQNNTRLVRTDEDSIAVVLHHTAVVTYHRNGTMTIYGGGWNTVTTKDRIRTYSPYAPHSDGNGGWIVGDTGKRTPAKVQKCRTCRGRGRWLEDDFCGGPYRWDGESWCDGATTVYDVAYVASNWAEHWASRREVPCEHGETGGHFVKPCQHGEFGRHVTGQSERTCYRCKGAGRVDYGSNPIPVTADASTPFRVDSDGTYLGIAAKPGTYPAHKYSAKPAAKKPAKPTVKKAAVTYDGGTVETALKAVVPGITSMVKHPMDGSMNTVSATIINLNDSHGWSREAIADWLETLDADLRFTIS